MSQFEILLVFTGVGILLETISIVFLQKRKQDKGINKFIPYITLSAYVITLLGIFSYEITNETIMYPKLLSFQFDPWFIVTFVAVYSLVLLDGVIFNAIQFYSPIQVELDGKSELTGISLLLENIKYSYAEELTDRVLLPVLWATMLSTSVLSRIVLPVTNIPLIDLPLRHIHLHSQSSVYVIVSVSWSIYWAFAHLPIEYIDNVKHRKLYIIRHAFFMVALCLTGIVLQWGLHVIGILGIVAIHFAHNNFVTPTFARILLHLKKKSLDNPIYEKPVSIATRS